MLSISLAVQGFTANDPAEVKSLLSIMVISHAGTYFIHESIDADNEYDFSRKRFARANSIFSEMVLKYAGSEF